MSEIQIYKDEFNQIEIEVNLDEDTVWLSLNQLVNLFNRDKSVISRHLKNIFSSKELERNSVVAFFATTATDGKIYNVEYFNLDVILSVGYRINSKIGTKFRQWATQRLKDYLVKGYSINQKRLEQLQKVVEVIQASNQGQISNLNQTQGLLDILTNYTKSFILLNQFDSNNLDNNYLNENITYHINYIEAKQAIEKLKIELINKNEASQLFGQEKDNSFAGTLESIIQTFGGQYLYPSIEEQAAHILYLIIKNHAFSDGNKRIGAFLFIWFLEKNKHRFKKSGEIKINDNGLVALSLLVAQSNPQDKELIIQLIINLINDR